VVINIRICRGSPTSAGIHPVTEDRGMSPVAPYRVRVKADEVLGAKGGRGPRSGAASIRSLWKDPALLELQSLTLSVAGTLVCYPAARNMPHCQVVRGCDLNDLETADVAALRARLRHVYWIGGGSGAGKSTIAGRLAASHRLGLYATDDVMSDHASRSTPEDSPLLHQFAAMDMDQRWVNRPAETMVETFHWFRGEGFGLIVEDLLRRPRRRGVIAEGFRLLPGPVKSLLAVPGHAVWLLPTPRFRRAALESRGTLWQIAAKTSDPRRALHNLLERDRMFTQRLYRDVKRLGLPFIEVDTTMTEDDLAEQVAGLFQLEDRGSFTR
jgi:hypothetical protein